MHSLFVPTRGLEPLRSQRSTGLSRARQLLVQRAKVLCLAMAVRTEKPEVLQNVVVDVTVLVVDLQNKLLPSPSRPQTTPLTHILYTHFEQSPPQPICNFTPRTLRFQRQNLIWAPSITRVLAFEVALACEMGCVQTVPLYEVLQVGLRTTGYFEAQEPQNSLVRHRLTHSPLKKLFCVLACHTVDIPRSNSACLPSSPAIVRATGFEPA